ncbi:MAG: SAM-dependent methyltransferase, partial [Clostridia bacterium]|nr:SAM-dependent methyltransferase [Clostridia bacterium]
HNAKYIFSVPCCQHEVNQTIKKGGDLDVLLKYGIVKERVSALLTDSIRAMLLEDEGYSVDVMEFVDLAHSPKNLMIRAVKTHGKTNKNRQKINELIKRYGFSQKLYFLLDNVD